MLSPLSQIGIFLMCSTQIQYLEHLNKLIDIERLVPPEDVDHEIHGGICKCDDFKVHNKKVFDGPCYALHHEPQCLEEDK